MSVQIEVISRRISMLLSLEQEMAEIIALRRALCLQNAKRNRPNGSRRVRIHRSSTNSLMRRPLSSKTCPR
jgi:hypothetical protein